MRVSDHDLGIDELRARLQESEETLRAILSGDVDGLVVAATDGDQVFSLRGAERPYRTFVEQMNEGALTISPDGLILFCNRRLGDLLSLSPDAIVGQYVGALPCPSLMECIAALLADPESQGAPQEIVCEAGGVARTLQVVGSRLQDEASLAILITDVTDARSRERALRRSNEEMEDRIRERTATLARTVDEVREARAAALNMMEDAVLAARALEAANRDLERQVAARREFEEAQRLLSTVVEQAGESIVITNTSGTIEYVNPAFERVTGYSRLEVIGQTPRMLKSGKQDDAFYENLWETITEGSVWTGHLVNRRKDGSLFEEESTISPVRDNDGTIAHFVAIKRDVTSEVALGEQLRHAQKMEAIGTLAGGVAHDFNNLLQAMGSITQLLRRTTADSRQMESLKQLEQSVRRGAQLTRQLLLFARRETSKREVLDINEILVDIEPLLRRLTRANIRLIVETADVALVMNADRGQIEQVLMNLSVNAIDAMPDGGVLWISARGDKTGACLEVTDTGTGIPLEVRDRIFEPFFTTKEVGRGTGLGLSVVHGIVSSHGGRISVDCPEGGGTTFRVFLPVTIESMPVKDETTAGENVPLANGERVLLVEDEEAAREGLVGVLELLGYSVVAVGCGEDAIAVGLKTPFSLLLTDFMLPDMTGLEVAQTLRSHRPSLRPIVMSGYGAPGETDARYSMKECEFLQKPFEMAELARTLRDALAEQTQ